MAQRGYEKLSSKRPSFKDFLMKGGPSFEGLELARDRWGMRRGKASV